MAILTELSIGDAQGIAGAYGLDVTGVRGILAGSVNSNFELTLASGARVFARIYEEQIAASAAGEAALLEHLAARGVATPGPLPRRDGGFVSEHAHKPVALFPWIDGGSLCQARVDPARASRVGAALARVHVAGAGFVGAPPSRFGPADLAARLDGLTRRGDLPPDVAAVVPQLAARLAPLLEAEAHEDGVIHGDLFRDNVLWRGDDITALLDFESASRGSFPFDLAVTVLAWCVGDRLDPALAQAMYRGYAEVRPPTADERARLFDAARFAALRFTVTRITDFELRPRGKGVHKDYRRFLARLEAIETMGRKGLAAALGAPPE